MIIIKAHIYVKNNLMQSKTKIINNSGVDGTLWLDINKNGIKPNVNDTVNLTYGRDNILESRYFAFRLSSPNDWSKLFKKDKLDLVGDLIQLPRLNTISIFKINEIKADADELFEAIELSLNTFDEFIEDEAKEWEELSDNQIEEIEL